MTHKPVRTRWVVRRWIPAVLLLAAVPFLGCAALSSKPIQDFKTVAGIWEGNLTRQAAQYGTTTGAATWIINEDGTFEMRTGKWQAKGVCNNPLGLGALHGQRSRSPFTPHAISAAWARADARPHPAGPGSWRTPRLRFAGTPSKERVRGWANPEVAHNGTIRPEVRPLGLGALHGQ